MFMGKIEAAGDTRQILAQMIANRLSAVAESMQAQWQVPGRIRSAYVDDLLPDPAAHAGQTYELGGPEQISVLDLNQRIAAAAERKVLFAPLPDALSGLFAAVTGWLPGAPLTRQQWQLLQAGNVVSGTLPGITALGVNPRPLGLYLPRWMVRFRRHGRFRDRLAG